MGKVNIKQLNVAPASGYVIGSGAGGVPVWKLEVTSVAWNQITGNQALVNLSGFTNDSGFITLGSLSAGTGISYNNLTGVITNSAPDQTVVLTQGTGITITGTYPSFTIASNGNQTITLSGDVAGSGTTGIVTTIANNVVSDAKIGLRAALSVMGRETNSIGNVADILFSTSNGVLHRSGSTLATGLLTGASISATNNQIFYGAGSLATQSANLTFDGTILSATSIINATIGFRVASAATTGNYLRGNGTNFVSSALTASDLAANSITDGLIRQSAGLSVIGRSANSAGNVADITAGTDHFVLRRSGTSIAFGLVNMLGIAATGTNIPHGSSLGTLTQATNFNFSGQVLGIGPTTPISAGRIHIARATVNCGIYSDQYSNTLGVSSVWYSRKSTGTTIGTPAATGNGDYLGAFYFDGVNTGNTFVTGAKIQVLQTGSSASSTVPAKLIFTTNGASTVNTNALVIDENGNTGFGTASTAVSAKVEIVSTTQGFLPPRMTATQGSAIASPAEGLMIYVTDTNGTFTTKGWWGYNGAAWQQL